MKTPTKKNNNAYCAFASRPMENVIPATNRNTIHGSLLFAPPPPPPSVYFSYPYNYNTPQSVFNPQAATVAAPPLLPLPMCKPNTLPSRTHSLNSTSPATRKSKPLTPKKSPKQSVRKELLQPTRQQPGLGTVPLLGPEPNDQPKVLTRTTSFAGNGYKSNNDVIVGVGFRDFERFSGSGFTLSPPPSSLPLPKFFIRPKMSCTAEAAGNIDDGATDNLRRLLRLR